MDEVGSYPALDWFEPNIRYCDAQRVYAMARDLFLQYRCLKSITPLTEWGFYMVFVAQSEECLIVIQEVVGSKPTIHPNNAHIVQWIEHSATNRGIGVRISLRVQMPL